MRVPVGVAVGVPVGVVVGATVRPPWDVQVHAGFLAEHLEILLH